MKSIILIAIGFSLMACSNYPSKLKKDLQECYDNGGIAHYRIYHVFTEDEIVCIRGLGVLGLFH